MFLTFLTIFLLLTKLSDKSGSSASLFVLVVGIITDSFKTKIKLNHSQKHGLFIGILFFNLISNHPGQICITPEGQFQKCVHEKNNKQAGAELGQAQLKLGLGFTSIQFGLPDSVLKICFSKFCCIYIQFMIFKWLSKLDLLDWAR